MACFYPFIALVVTVLMSSVSNGQNVGDNTTRSTVTSEEPVEDTNSTSNGTDSASRVMSSQTTQEAELTPAISSDATVTDLATSPRTLNETENKNGTVNCELCSAKIISLLDEAKSDGKEIGQKIARNCLDFAAGRNDHINCVRNSIGDCRDNGTRFAEIQKDLTQRCQKECPAYKTITAEIDVCFQNFTEIRELENSAKFTRFCRLLVDHEACIQSTTGHCTAEVNKLAIAESIERFGSDEKYNQLKRNANYTNVCNQECAELDDIHQNATNCAQFIVELRSEDTQQQENLKCSSASPCAFDVMVGATETCPTTEKLVESLYPNYKDILSTFSDRCVKIGLRYAETRPTNVTKQALLEEEELATRRLNFTQRQYNVTSAPLVNKTAVMSETTSLSYTEETSGLTSSANTEETSGTTSPPYTDETSGTTSPTSAHPTTRRPVLRKLTPGRKSATKPMWIPCSKKDKAAVSESTSKSSGVRASHIVIGLTLMVLLVNEA